MLQSGLIEYGRMFCLMLWSRLPYLAIVGVAMYGSHLAKDHAEQAVLESQADFGKNLAHWALLAAFVLAQCMMESARAAFIADTALGSATRAFGRGINQLLCRLFRTLFFYRAVSVIGLVITGIAGVTRIHVTAAETGGFLTASLLGQLIVVALGWMRIARLFALAEVACSIEPGPRRATAFTESVRRVR